jgi:hypothetical protein
LFLGMNLMIGGWSSPADHTRPVTHTLLNPIKARRTWSDSVFGKCELQIKLRFLHGYISRTGWVHGAISLQSMFWTTISDADAQITLKTRAMFSWDALLVWNSGKDLDYGRLVLYQTQMYSLQSSPLTLDRCLWSFVLLTLLWRTWDTRNGETFRNEPLIQRTCSLELVMILLFGKNTSMLTSSLASAFTECF